MKLSTLRTIVTWWWIFVKGALYRNILSRTIDFNGEMFSHRWWKLVNTYPNTWLFIEISNQLTFSSKAKSGNWEISVLQDMCPIKLLRSRKFTWLEAHCTCLCKHCKKTSTLWKQTHLPWGYSSSILLWESFLGVETIEKN